MTETKRLLIVEDDPVLSELMSDYCEEMGVTALVALDGAAGIRLAMEKRPDAVTVDHRLPDLSGLDLLTRLKADPATRDIPLFFVSADAATHEREARTRGAVEVLQKPVSEALLKKTLEKHLGAI